MNENHPKVILLKNILKEKSACHYCGRPMVLVEAEIKDGKAKGLIYCDPCEELSRATFILND